MGKARTVTEDEERIRRKAYELWEAEGRPEGRDMRNWEEAREIVALKDSFASTLQPLEETTADTVEPALAYENQGEFPEMTDLGEGTRGPSWAAAKETAGLEAVGSEQASAESIQSGGARSARRDRKQPARQEKS